MRHRLRPLLSRLLAGAAAAAFTLPSIAAAPIDEPLLPWVLDDRAAVPPTVRSQVFGRFDGMDPQRLGRIWRVGRDPRNCAQAVYLGGLQRVALDDLRRGLDRELAQGPHARAERVRDHELAIADALVFAGREADAEDHLQQRLAARLPESGDRWKSAVDGRRHALELRLATLFEATRPDEAERLRQKVLRDRAVERDESFRARTRGYPADGEVAAYERRMRDRSLAQSRHDVLVDPLLRAGQAREALQIVQELIGAHERIDAASRTRSAHGPEVPDALRLRADVIAARIAADAGRTDEAIEAYRRCCALSRGGAGHAAGLHLRGLQALTRLLLDRGRRDDAVPLALRLALERAWRIEGEFECMTVPVRGAGPAAEAAAQKRADEALANTEASARLSERITSSSQGGSGAGRAARLPQIGAELDAATDLGLLLLDAGLPHDARDVIEPTRALLATLFGRDHPMTLRALASLARIERARGRLSQAAELGIAWRAGSEEFLSLRLWNVSEAVRRTFFRDDRMEVDRWLDTALAAGRPDAAEQVLALSLGRKGLLARVAGEVTQLARRHGDAPARARLAKVQERREAFAAAALRDAADQPDGLRLRRELGALEAELAAAVRKTRAAAPPVTPRRLLGALGSDEALVDFVVFADPVEPSRERMVAVVARAPDRLALVQWPDLSELRRRGLELRGAVQDGDRAAAEAAAAALAAVWWQPLEPHLAGSRRIRVVPDGLLQTLPLAALPRPDGRLLIDTSEIVQLASARDVMEPDEPPPAGAATALVIGAPDFATAATSGAQRLAARDAGGLRFAPLPGALQESRRIATALAGGYRVDLLTGPRADKASLKRARSPTLVHLATHGFLLDDPTRPDTAGGDPLLSLARAGIALAGGGAREGGLLTALEAASLDLRRSRLVVLSACDTALGQTARGDGTYGLVRAFREAGAKAVLGTLWPVADEATGEFMQALYGRLRAGAAPPSALRATQLEFARHDRWSHPRHWAGFALTGQ